MVYKPGHKRIYSWFCICCKERLNHSVQTHAVCEDCVELGRYDVAG